MFERVAFRGTWVPLLLVFFGGMFGATAIGFLAYWPTGVVADGIKTAGGFLQFAGLVTVGRSIAAVRRSFELEPELTEIGRDIKRFFGSLRGRRYAGQATSTLSGVTSTGTVNVGAVTSRVNSNNLGIRLAHLEGRVDSLSKALSASKSQVRGDMQQIRTMLLQETRERGSALGTVDTKIKTLAIGGIRDQSIGVGWLVLGTLGTTWYAEFGIALPKLWNAVEALAAR